jgi:hypothetical protein
VAIRAAPPSAAVPRRKAPVTAVRVIQPDVAASPWATDQHVAASAWAITSRAVARRRQSRPLTLREAKPGGGLRIGLACGGRRAESEWRYLGWGRGSSWATPALLKPGLDPSSGSTRSPSASTMILTGTYSAGGRLLFAIVARAAPWSAPYSSYCDSVVVVAPPPLRLARRLGAGRLGLWRRRGRRASFWAR